MNELQGMELVEGEYYYLATNPQSGNSVVLIGEVDRLPPKTKLLVLETYKESRKTLTVTFTKAEPANV